MAKKVFELARELGLGITETLTKLKAEGFLVRNHMSEVSEKEIFDFKERMKKKNLSSSPLKPKEQSSENKINAVTKYRTLLVRGINYSNSDGSSRKEVFAKCVVGEEIILEREKNNKHDSNAIKVCRKDHTQLGYVSRVEAALIAPLLDSGEVINSKISLIAADNEPRCYIILTSNSLPAEETETDVVDVIKGIGQAYVGLCDSLFGSLFDGLGSKKSSVSKRYSEEKSTSSISKKNCPGCGGVGCHYCSEDHSND